MEDKGKKIPGILYGPDSDGELLRKQRDAKNTCHYFNQLPPHMEEGYALLKKLFGRVGEKLSIMQPFWCDFGYNIEIGENFYANHNCVILDCALVKFGDNVLVGPNCGFYAATHPIDAEQRSQGLEYAEPIVVGDNVWFGGGVQVLPGVTIGDNAVICAGSVVTKDIPSGVIAAGNPCKVLRGITKDDKIDTASV